jgi:quercetin dioxygenase-like cupin family protein
VEAVLDSGEVRTLVVGDSLIQRATTHGWRNTSEDTAAAMIIVAVPAKE